MEVSSGVELYLRDKVAKELFTPQGKTAVVFIWTLLTFLAAYGCSQVEVAFKMDFFIKPTSNVYNFLKYNEEYFKTGFAPFFYINCPECEFDSIETQFELIEFQERLGRCDSCDESWFKANTLGSWYNSYRLWVASGECYLLRGGIKPFDKVVNPDFFYECLEEYMVTD